MDAARMLRPVNADATAVFIVLVKRETSLRSAMMDAFVEKRCASNIRFVGCNTPNDMRPDACPRIYWTMVLITQLLRQGRIGVAILTWRITVHG
jgi:hypothetical protein